MKLRYTGPDEKIEHDGVKLKKGVTIDVSDRDGESIMSHYRRVFERVAEAKAAAKIEKAAAKPVGGDDK